MRERIERTRSKNKVITIIILFVTISLSMLGVIFLQGRIQGGIRSYVRGEGLWAKAQKDAVLHLTKYLHSRNESDYQAFLSSLQVPLGDKRARITLDSEHPDYEIAYAGFIDGQNDPEDVPSMIWFFSSFRDISYMRDAIIIWEDGDEKIAELSRLGSEIHNNINTGRLQTEVSSIHERLNRLSLELLVLENRFSTVLSDAARDIDRLLWLASAILLAGFIAGGVVVSNQIIAGITKVERQLIVSEAQFQCLSTSNTIGFISWSTDGRIDGANNYFLDLVGYERADLDDDRLDWRSMTPEEYHARDTQAIDEIMRTGSCTPFEKAFFRKGGGEVPVLIGGSLLKEGGSRGMAFIMDLTEKKRQEEEIKLASIVFNASSEGIVITDPEMRIASANQAFCDITGYTIDELVGQTPKLLKSGYSTADKYEEIWCAIGKEGFWQGELMDRRKDGSLLPIHMSLSAETDDRGKVIHYISIITDISEGYAYREELRHMAQHDVLTGLPNRNSLNERLKEVMAKAKSSSKQFGVLFLDLNGFKTVNDEHGHLIGDKLLQCIANRLRPLVRSTDIVARLGGDEFVILLEDISDVAMVAELSERVGNAVAVPCEVDDLVLSVGVSIGVGIYPRDGDDLETLMHHADVAMYRAKNRRMADRGAPARAGEGSFDTHG